MVLRSYFCYLKPKYCFLNSSSQSINYFKSSPILWMRRLKDTSYFIFAPFLESDLLLPSTCASLFLKSWSVLIKFCSSKGRPRFMPKLWKATKRCTLSLTWMMWGLLIWGIVRFRQRSCCTPCCTPGSSSSMAPGDPPPRRRSTKKKGSPGWNSSELLFYMEYKKIKDFLIRTTRCLWMLIFWHF